MVLFKSIFGFLALLAIPVCGQHIFSQSGETTLSKGTEVGRFEIPENFDLKFKVKPSGTVENDFGSIIHFSNGGDCCTPGERMPAIWFYPGTTKIQVSLDTNSKGDWTVLVDKEIPLDQVTEVKLSTLGDKVFIYMNNTLVKDATAPSQRVFGFSNLYLGDPWHEPAKATLFDVVLSPGVSNDLGVAVNEAFGSPSSPISNSNSNTISTEKFSTSVTNNDSSVNYNGPVDESTTSTSSSAVKGKTGISKVGDDSAQSQHELLMNNTPLGDSNSNINVDYTEVDSAKIKSKIVSPVEPISPMENDPTLKNGVTETLFGNFASSSNSPMGDGKYSAPTGDYDYGAGQQMSSDQTGDLPKECESDIGSNADINSDSVPIIVGASVGAASVSAAALIFFMRRRNQLKTSNASENTNNGTSVSPNQLYANA